MTKFSKGDLIFINSNQFVDAVRQFRGKWTAMGTATGMATATAMGMATGTATKTATGMAMATEMEVYPYILENLQSNEEVKLKYYGTDWKELNQNLTGIVQEVVSEEHPDFHVIKVYCQQEGSVRLFRRFILEQSVSRQPASLTHLNA